MTLGINEDGLIIVGRRGLKNGHSHVQVDTRLSGQGLAALKQAGFVCGQNIGSDFRPDNDFCSGTCLAQA